MRKLVSSLALMGLLAAPVAVSGQTTLGPFLAFHDDWDFGVGAYAVFPAPELHENLAFSGSFGYFFPDQRAGADLNYWELNADAILRIPTEATGVRFFLLGGINIARWSVDAAGGDGPSDTDAGLNLGAGVSFPQESMTPTVGAKLQIEGGDGFMIFGGIGFPVG